MSYLLGSCRYRAPGILAVKLADRLKSELAGIQRAGNYREIKYLKPISATRILYQGKEYINLCSNSYLSLNFEPRVIEAARKVLDEYGAGSCSSRSVSGSLDLYETLGSEVALYKGYEKGLVFSNGYMANMGIVTTLAGADDTIFSDELNHSSLIDSIRLSKARTVIYRHLDADDLERRLKKTKTRGNRFIVTETVFSMDGDVAPLDQIHRLKENYGATLIVDEAHATGVFGPRGRGVEEVFGLEGMMDVQMGTFGKALGSFGAFVLSKDLVIDYLVNRARTFMYTTALPAGILAAAREALRIVSVDTSLRDALWERIAYMRQGLKSAGFDLKGSQGPIIPIVVGDDSRTVRMQKILLDKGIFLQAIRPPTVPPGTSRLRLTVVRGFSKEEMDRALEALQDAGEKAGLI